MIKRLLSRLATPLLICLACAVIALLSFAGLADEMLEGDTRKFDAVVRQFVHAHSSSWLTAAMQWVTILGSALFVSIAAISGTAALWVKGQRRKALLIAITVIGGSLLMWVLKISYHRERPQPFFDTKLPASYGFPSGHALLSFCLCGAGAFLFSDGQKKRWIRIVIWASAVVVVFAIGYSRIYLGVHYPSDVVAGYLAALVWVLGVGSVFRQVHSGKFRHRASRNVE